MSSRFKWSRNKDFSEGVFLSDFDLEPNQKQSSELGLELEMSILL